MDHPVREIPGVITALTQGNSEDQAKALEDYFLPDAYFVHPLCRVPSFRDFVIPLPFVEASRRTVNSRHLILLIYEWYRIMSPKIVFTIDSVVFDKRASLLYLTIRQTFTLWFVPFSLWQANVKLVTVLDLALLPVEDDHIDEHSPPRTLVARAGAETAAEDYQDDGKNKNSGNDHNGYDTSATMRTRFFIRGQEDHYHMEEWIKFVAPWGASLLWVAWQLFATFLCALGVALWPFGLVRAVKRRQGRKQKKQA